MTRQLPRNAHPNVPAKPSKAPRNKTQRTSATTQLVVAHPIRTCRTNRVGRMMFTEAIGRGHHTTSPLRFRDLPSCLRQTIESLQRDFVPMPFCPTRRRSGSTIKYLNSMISAISHAGYLNFRMNQAPWSFLAKWQKNTQEPNSSGEYPTVGQTIRRPF